MGHVPSADIWSKSQHGSFLQISSGHQQYLRTAITDSTQLQQAGANARAAGTSIFKCPFFVKDQCPLQTGETTSEWNVKVEAWYFGWNMEDAMRSGV